MVFRGVQKQQSEKVNKMLHSKNGGIGNLKKSSRRTGPWFALFMFLLLLLLVAIAAFVVMIGRGNLVWQRNEPRSLETDIAQELEMPSQEEIAAQIYGRYIHADNEDWLCSEVNTEITVDDWYPEEDGSGSYAELDVVLDDEVMRVTGMLIAAFDQKGQLYDLPEEELYADYKEGCWPDEALVDAEEVLLNEVAIGDLLKDVDSQISDWHVEELMLLGAKHGDHGKSYQEELTGTIVSKGVSLDLSGVLNYAYENGSWSFRGLDIKDHSILTMNIQEEPQEQVQEKREEQVQEEPQEQLQGELREQQETAETTNQEVRIFFYDQQLPDFTMHSDEKPVTVWAGAYENGVRVEADFRWSCDDDTCLAITIGEDSRYCTCTFLKLSTDRDHVILTASTGNASCSIPVYLRE